MRSFICNFNLLSLLIDDIIEKSVALEVVGICC